MQIFQDNSIKNYKQSIFMLLIKKYSISIRINCKKIRNFKRKILIILNFQKKERIKKQKKTKRTRIKIKVKMILLKCNKRNLLQKRMVKILKRINKCKQNKWENILSTKRMWILCQIICWTNKYLNTILYPLVFIKV